MKIDSSSLFIPLISLFFSPPASSVSKSCLPSVGTTYQGIEVFCYSTNSYHCCWFFLSLSRHSQLKYIIVYSIVMYYHCSWNSIVDVSAIFIIDEEGWNWWGENGKSTKILICVHVHTEQIFFLVEVDKKSMLTCCRQGWVVA